MPSKNNENTNSFYRSLDKIKSLLLGGNVDKTKKDQEIEDIFNSISDKLNNQISSIRQDSIKTFLTKNIFSDINKDEFENFLNLNSSIMSDTENKNRIRRYILSDEIVDNIPYAEAALKVISTETISPDDISKDSLMINSYGAEDDNTLSKIEQLENIKEKFNLEYILYPIIYNTLKYGDQFIEICDYTDEQIPISQTLLTEEEIKEINNLKKERIFESSIIINKVIKKEEKEPEYKNLKEIKFEIELECNNDELYDLIEQTKNISSRKKRKLEKNKEKTNINNFQLIIHDPAFVIKIQTKRFKNCLGYLIIPKMDYYTNSMAYPIPSQTASSNMYNSMGNTSVAFEGIDELYAKMLELVKKNITQNDISIDKNEVSEIFQRIAKEVDTIRVNKMKIRYVPIERMEHFSINNNRFFPYGESIFYKTFFSAKLLILQEVLATMKRMNDAVDTNIYRIESNYTRTARNYISQLKETLHKQRISLDSFGSISSIPSNIMSHQDIFIPQTKGNPAVVIEKMDKNSGSGREATEELKYFRDLFVSSLGVPPSYVGLEENVSGNNRNLTHQSIMFSKSIITYQKLFSKQFKNLLYRIYKLINNEILSVDLKVSFPPPKYIVTEIIAERVRLAKEIIDTVTELGYDKDYFIKELMPFDFEEIKKYKVLDDVDKKIEGIENQDQSNLNSFQEF